MTIFLLSVIHNEQYVNLHPAYFCGQLDNEINPNTLILDLGGNKLSLYCNFSAFLHTLKSSVFDQSYTLRQPVGSNVGFSALDRESLCLRQFDSSCQTPLKIPLTGFSSWISVLQ